MSAVDGDLAGRVEAIARAVDGRLFLARGEGFDAQALFGEPFDDLARLERLWTVGLERRARLCREMGATLVVLIAPEAHGVHADDLPPPLAYAVPSVGDRFAALARSLGITTVFPREALTAARGPVEVFRRNDSHWSAFGAQIGWRAVMDALPPHLARGRAAAGAVRWRWTEAVGDLAWSGQTVERRPCLEPLFETPRAHVVLRRSNERRHGLAVCEIDDPGLPTALVYRDSYGAELSPFLAECFRRTVFVGAEERGYPEMIAEERPDLVILERSERSLLNGLVDWGLETWREAFPDAGDDPGAHAAELAARTALAAGDAALALVEADRAVAAEPTVARTILAGRAALAAGSPAEAAEILEAARVQEPDRWTALMHLGVARVAMGQPGPARDLFARACATAPWNPGGFEHFGFAALHDGDAASALPALRTAVRLGPEIAGAHLWLIEALDRLGRAEEARGALVEGLRCCPQDALLQARAARVSSHPPTG